MSAKFRARALLNWCLMNCCETGQSVLLHKYVHRKSLRFPVTYIARVWGQQPYAACTLDKQTIANNLSCSLYVLNTLPQKTMCFSLWAKFIQIKLRVLPSTWQIRSNPQGDSSWPGRHQGIGTAPPTQTSCIICTGNHWRFPRNLLEIVLIHPRWVSFFPWPPGRLKKRNSHLWCSKWSCKYYHLVMHQNDMHCWRCGFHVGVVCPTVYIYII